VARIELWNGDICDLEVDAVVSPASPSLWMSTGVAGEIKRAGGDEIEFAAIRQAPAQVGDAIATTAGRLAAKIVIHAVSLERDRRTSATALDLAARSAMARVREFGLASVAFPALGTGIGGFPLDEAARIAVNAVRDELQTPSSIEHVIFALRGAVAYEAFAAALSAGEPAPGRSMLMPAAAAVPGAGASDGEGDAIDALLGRGPAPAEPA
jgi:O-acetyl-ADP-ribose deacetylase